MCSYDEVKFYVVVTGLKQEWKYVIQCCFHWPFSRSIAHPVLQFSGNKAGIIRVLSPPNRSIITEKLQSHAVFTQHPQSMGMSSSLPKCLLRLKTKVTSTTNQIIWIILYLFYPSTEIHLNNFFHYSSGVLAYFHPTQPWPEQTVSSHFRLTQLLMENIMPRIKTAAFAFRAGRVVLIPLHSTPFSLSHVCWT